MNTNLSRRTVSSHTVFVRLAGCERGDVVSASPYIKPTLLGISVVGPALALSANPAKVPGTRTTSILHKIPGLPVLPTLEEVQSIQKRQANTTLNLNDIQFDIVVGQQKIKQLFYFFSIQNATDFKTKLKNNVAPIVTSAQQMLTTSTQPIVAVNIAFSQTGLTALGVTDNVGSGEFNGGQFQSTFILGDDPANWVTALAGTTVHGVFLLASDTEARINTQVAALETALGTSITKRHSLLGASRPAPNVGHEMFGFLDGIGQPAIIGFQTPNPGQMPTKPGVIILGMDGDGLATVRPSWSIGGSFMAFRQLDQLVPEFNKFLLDRAPAATGLTVQQRADKFGARLIGRWKSGAPVDLFPTADNATAGTDKNVNSAFTFDHTNEGFDFATDQTHCPFGAHIRAMRPRADVTFDASNNMIMRAGIPYGPEVTSAESQSNTTTQQRGFAFVAYQTAINRGFVELQVAWANTENAFSKTPAHGVDPIIGTPVSNRPNRWITGMDPANPTANITYSTSFVVSRGGEYFLTPPISALTGRLSQ
ncbi:dye-decolorizing peroxidase precursor [Auriculariales sp. MPI-PUGE-AT-0066]|nr:dye-decolorizing peroxidase precursor [Auriculariales sp. MPI-PUGE-AT-0066]